MFPMIIGMAIESSVSVNRIQRFLLEVDIEEKLKGDDKEFPIKIENGIFEWDKLPEKNPKKGEDKLKLLNESENVVEKKVGRLSDINVKIKKGNI